METKKIIIAVGLVLMAPLYVISNLINNEGLRSEPMQDNDSLDKNNQSGFIVKTIELSYAERVDDTLNDDQTTGMSISRGREVVHSVEDAKAVLERLKDKPGFTVMIPIGIWHTTKLPQQ